MNGQMTYAIRVDGHLDDHWSGWFGGLTLTHNGDGTSTLTGSAADQAQLHGILARLRDIGATLLDLRATGRTRPATERTRPVDAGPGLPRTAGQPLHRQANGPVLESGAPVDGAGVGPDVPSGYM
jgi:hypothetical protein